MFGIPVYTNGPFHLHEDMTNSNTQRSSSSQSGKRMPRMKEVLLATVILTSSPVVRQNILRVVMKIMDTDIKLTSAGSCKVFSRGSLGPSPWV